MEGLINGLIGGFGSQTDVLVSARTLGQKQGKINGRKMEGGRID